jgi:hypothetical protein
MKLLLLTLVVAVEEDIMELLVEQEELVVGEMVSEDTQELLQSQVQLMEPPTLVVEEVEEEKVFNQTQVVDLVVLVLLLSLIHLNKYSKKS